MKKGMSIILFILLLLFPIGVRAYDGIPYFINFSAEEYGGHNRNFDIVTDRYGHVFVANFEGLMYYDGVTFSMLHTEGISRLTRLLKDSKERIWYGGYNVFGLLETDKKGCLYLRSLLNKSQTIGEVVGLKEVKKGIEVSVLSGNTYLWDGKQLQLLKKNNNTEEKAQEVEGYEINDNIVLPNGVRMVATDGIGVIAYDKNSRRLFSLSSKNGLCSDNVQKLSYNGCGRVWGTTDNGIFCMYFPAVFTRYSQAEGLEGEVLSIAEHHGNMYVGTIQGIFINRGTYFERLGNFNGSCWQLIATNTGLYAATSVGVIKIEGKIYRHVTQQHTLSVLPNSDGSIIAGELKGVYSYKSGVSTLVFPKENVVKIMQGKEGTIFMQDIYGSVYYKLKNGSGFVKVNKLIGLADNAILNLFVGNNSLDIISNSVIYEWDVSNKKFNAVDTLSGKFSYPRFIFTDQFKYIWITDNAGKNITPFKNRKIDKSYASWLMTIDDEEVRAMNVRESNVLLGGSFGLVSWTRIYDDPSYKSRPQVYIRKIRVTGDSIIWGGYDASKGMRPRTDFEEYDFDNNHRSVFISYSTPIEPVFGDIKYRYHITGSTSWSKWSEKTSVEFHNLSPGSYTFEVQAMDAFGRVSDISSIRFRIESPWYLRWWAQTFYALILLLIVTLLSRWRTKRLLKEKVRLEGIVNERTAEIRQQKDELQEKSVSLENALTELEQAQKSLVRQEKMATAGKLTQGLIDRILNPINYINNFSSLTVGLAKDVEADVDDVKDKIDEDTYDDLLDVTGMIKDNLNKIVDHGTNTSRILKAMEEMLRDRSIRLERSNIAAICQQDFEMFNKYFADDIKKMSVKTEIEGCNEPVNIYIDAAQISKCILSVLNNTIHAVGKKYQQKPFEPLVKLSLEVQEDKVLIRIYDNGIGIEESIVDKIFDPVLYDQNDGGSIWSRIISDKRYDTRT